ncbi:hypothetical protein VB620_06795 [Nodularia harveyana UHCC-0300]|uniref:Phospholipid/glycerol acyltransferase domain-containing protein n=1 Tax=Nodularia harveyana UHCC-0300 TaxID=2974287 RepID=A0ABU5UDG9_9CYAN|nr:hypothetical protein [Nodularia harveyana]MEA5581046.1 hypothetical protein [Nodularia harveyana UHCC-0300]
MRFKDFVLKKAKIILAFQFFLWYIISEIISFFLGKATSPLTESYITSNDLIIDFSQPSYLLTEKQYLNDFGHHKIFDILLDKHLTNSEKRYRLNRRLSYLFSNYIPTSKSWVLPYGIGHTFLKWFCQKTWVRNRFFDNKVALIKEFLILMDHSVISENDIIEQSLINNCWLRWKYIALSQMNHISFNHWVKIIGFSNFQKIYQQKQGVILLTNRSVLVLLIILILYRANLEKNMGIIGTHKEALQLLSLSDDWIEEMIPEEMGQDRLKGLKRQTFKCHKILKRGGIVIITPDAIFTGKKALIYPFFNRPRLFQPGFAKMALTTNSICMPVNISLTSTGQIEVKFMEPFQTIEGSKQEKISNLVEQYANYLEKVWKKDFSNLMLDDLPYFTVPK